MPGTSPTIATVRVVPGRTCFVSASPQLAEQILKTDGRWAERAVKKAALALRLVPLDGSAGKVAVQKAGRASACVGWAGTTTNVGSAGSSASANTLCVPRSLADALELADNARVTVTPLKRRQVCDPMRQVELEPVSWVLPLLVASPLRLGGLNSRTFLVSSRLAHHHHHHHHHRRANDWEIIELNAGYLEAELLGQVSILFPGQIVPVWLQKGAGSLVRLRVTSARDVPQPRGFAGRACGRIGRE